MCAETEKTSLIEGIACMLTQPWAEILDDKEREGQTRARELMERDLALLILNPFSLNPSIPNPSPAVYSHDFVASDKGFEVGDLFFDIFSAVHFLPVDEGEDANDLESSLSAR